MPNDVLAATNRSSLTSPLSAIRDASARTGIDFEYLIKTAQRESSLNPNAQAPTSSASGLFQFIEQTWLGAVKIHGAKHGLAREAADITRGEDGKFTVRNEQTRQQILDLRFNVQHASALAGELAADNQAGLERKLGRALESGAAGNGALYAAHFLGLNGAVKLLSADENAIAATLLPSAAKANPSIFYNNNREKTVGELISSFQADFERTNPIASSDGLSQSNTSPKSGSLEIENPLENLVPVENLVIGQQKSGVIAPTQSRRETDIRKTDSLSTVNGIKGSEDTPLQNTQIENNRPLLTRIDPLAVDQKLSPLALQVLLSLDPAILRQNSSAR